MTPDTDLSEFLHPYPLIQAAAAALVVITSVVIAWRAMRSSPRRDPDYAPPQIYLSGPLAQILLHLEKILDNVQGSYRVLTEMRAETKELMADQRGRHEQTNDILRDVLKELERRPRR